MEPDACCFAAMHASQHHKEEAGPPTGPGGRPPGLFVTHAQWAGGRPFRIFQWAGWAGVV